MARSPRITNPSESTVYHLISRTTLPGFPLGEAEKDHFVELVRKFSKIYFVEMLGFCCMGNHFHLLVRMLPGEYYSNEVIRKRFKFCYGSKRKLLDGQIPHYRDKWEDLSKFMKDVKLSFTRYYNKKYEHQGYFWGDRFKSVIVEDGNALINCLAYIDLNPVRAGLVERPEDYRWSSIGWHVQTGNKGAFLSSEFGLADYNGLGIAERLRQYRRFIYEIGSLDRGKGAVIKSAILDEERQGEYELTRFNRFKYRTKYFTDSGIIGSKEFVDRIYNAVRHRLPSKRKKIPKEVKGLDGIFSLKSFIEENPQP